MSVLRFKNILLFSLFLVSVRGTAQTVFATETFGSGSAKGTSANGFSGDLGNWTVTNTGTNGGSANNWYVSGEECGNAAGTCGSGCSGGDNSLHISAIGGLCSTPDCGAAYDETSTANQTNKRAISPTIDCTGKSGIQLSFNYIAAQGDDGFFVEYSTDNGSTWSTFTGGSVAASQCCSCLDAFLCSFGFCCPPQTTQACTGGEQGFWTTVTLNFPVAADNNPNVRFAYHWSNDGNGFGTDPSVAIDDISLLHSVILPIELTDFNILTSDNINMLTWVTASESQSSHFIVEHADDGRAFTEVGMVNSAGDSQVKQFYQMNHEVRSGDHYYRLKSVDLNGDFSYSDTVMTTNTINGIYFSQQDGQLSVRGLENRTGFVLVADSFGRIIQQGSFERSQLSFEISTSQLPAGLYFITVESDYGNKKFKFFNP